MWQETRAFAREMAASSTPVHFTYFINAAYFLPDSRKDEYQAPRHNKGESLLGFGGSDAEVAARIAEVDAAYSEGHEIGSHTVGHFDGGTWSAADWHSELTSFSDILFPAAPVLFDSKRGSLFSFPASEIVGFRAPDLGVTPGLYVTLPKLDYRYDASLPGNGEIWPKKIGSIWEFPLATIRLGRTPALSMDYSIFQTQTGGKNTAKKGTPEWDALFNQLLGAYRDYFNKNYDGARAPVYIAHHFSKWNDGLYWEVMKAFAREVCGKAETHCVSYKELADELDAHP